MFALFPERPNESKALGLSWFRIGLIFLFRMFLCTTIRTVEAPDAWWQSVEVAYYFVFGKGKLTWEWENGLRSIAFPGIYAVPFYILKILSMDTAWTVWFAQQVQQAIILTAIDVSVFRIGAQIDLHFKEDNKKTSRLPSEKSKLFNATHPMTTTGSVASFALTLSLTNWYMAFAGVRAYSSVLEALCILLVLQQRNYISYLAWSGMACVIRVTSAVIIIPLLKIHIVNAASRHGILYGLMYILKWGLFMLVLILGLSTVADRCFFGRWVFTYLEFLRFNVVEGVSSYYGVHPWYFFVFPFLPFLIGPHIILVVYALFWCFFHNTYGRVSLCTRYLIGLLIWTLICYSCIPHKETRFIFPLIPLCSILSAVSLAQMYQRLKSIRLLHIFGIALNIVLILFMGYVFRRGPGDIMAEIRNGPKINRLDIVSTCYTTPGYSFIHGKVKELGIIDCPYQTDKLTKQRVLTEDDMFRRYPKDYVLWKYTGIHTFNTSNPTEIQKMQEMESVVLPKSVPLPDVMVMFRYTTNELQEEFLNRYDYIHYRSFLHTPITLFPYEDLYIDMWARRIR